MWGAQMWGNTYHTDRFKRKEHRSEEQWELGDRANGPLSLGGHGLAENVIANDHKRDDRYEIGQRREWRKVFEISNLQNAS